MFTSSRGQSLDVLRGVAVLLVIVDHYSLVIHSGNPIFSTLGRGVDLFFVLSGFLISGLLFSEYRSTQTLNLKRFWIRRGFKIYPAFYIFVLITTIFAVPSRMPGKVFLSEALFLQGYFRHFWVHTWSLAVEEHFYFALPILFLLLIRLSQNRENPFRALPFISVLISAACFYMRVLAGRHGGQLGIPTHLRIDALFAGVALGYYAHFDHRSFRDAKRSWVLIIGLVFALALLIMPIFLQLTFAYMAFSFIVAWAANREPQRSGYFGRPIAFIGRHSYSIYLWHAVVVLWLAWLPASWFRFPAYAVTAILMGVVMSRLVEFPVLRLREKFFPSIPRQLMVPQQASANGSVPAPLATGEGVA